MSNKMLRLPIGSLSLKRHEILRPILGKQLFVIASAGRSGSAMIAQRLNEIGIACGHEEIFTSNGRMIRRHLIGDSSWLSVPYLHDFNGTVVHLVRNPIKTVQSFLDIGFFDVNFNNKFSRFARRYVPITGNPVTDGFRWYVTWNRRIENFAAARFDIDQSKELVKFVACTLGQNLELLKDYNESDQKINVKNEKKVRKYDADPEKINDKSLRNDLEQMCVRYGYNIF